MSPVKMFVEKIILNIRTFTKEKTRLCIEYTLIGLLITMAGLTLTLWSQKDGLVAELTNVKIRVVKLEFDVTMQNQTIKSLQGICTPDLNKTCK